MAMLMLMPMLIACQPEGDMIPDVSDSDDASASENPPEPPKDPLSLTSGNKCKYTVIRPETCSDAVKKLAVLVKNTLGEYIDGFVSIKEDFLFGDMKPAEYEILVGLTNREESQNAANELKYRDYSVRIEGKKLTVNAYTDEGIEAATAHVLAFIENAGADLTFTDADQITVRAEYALGSIKMGDISLEGYTIILPKASPTMVAASTTVGIPIAITGICIVSFVSAFLLFPTPDPGWIPVSVI